MGQSEPNIAEQLDAALAVSGMRARLGFSDEQRQMITAALADGKTWDEIGALIGWHGPTAREWFEGNYPTRMLGPAPGTILPEVRMTRLYVDGVQIGEGEGQAVSPEGDTATFSRVRFHAGTVKQRPGRLPVMFRVTLEGQDGEWLPFSWPTTPVATGDGTTDLVVEDLRFVLASAA